MAAPVGGRLTGAQIEPPLDLKPQRVDFEFELPGKGANGWSLVVDPDGAVDELCEGNNRVELEHIRSVGDMVAEVRSAAGK